jgi:hypothetical protein
VICFAHLSLPAGSAIAGRLGAPARPGQRKSG